MPHDDPADVRRANAGAFKLVGAVQSLENVEQLVRIVRIEPHAIVTNKEDGVDGLTSSNTASSGETPLFTAASMI